MLLRTEILHDFDTFSPSPQVSFKKKKKKGFACPQFPTSPSVDPTRPWRTWVYVPAAFAPPRTAPCPCVLRLPISGSRSAAGCALVRLSTKLPSPCRVLSTSLGKGEGGGVRSYDPWRGSAAAWGSAAKRENRAAHKRV